MLRRVEVEGCLDLEIADLFAQRPKDYVESFNAFVRDFGNELPALHRPWELTRKDLRELKLALDA